VLHVSTDYVFDGRATRPYHEYDMTGPRSAYGRSKLAGEQAVRALNPRHYVVRTAWVYHHTHSGNFPQTMLRLAEKGGVRVVSDQFGSPTYAPHLARAIAELLGTAAFGTWHFAGAGEASWYDLTRELFAQLGIGASVTPVSTAEFPRPAERPRYAVLATIQEPRIVLPDWREGVAEFAAAIRSASR
jgi:dTDP-4-dehydrorhamnose reductase